LYRKKTWGVGSVVTVKDFIIYKTPDPLFWHHPRRHFKGPRYPHYQDALIKCPDYPSEILRKYIGFI